MKDKIDTDRTALTKEKLKQVRQNFKQKAKEMKTRWLKGKCLGALHTTFEDSNREILLGMVDGWVEKNINRAFIDIHKL